MALVAKLVKRSGRGSVSVKDIARAAELLDSIALTPNSERRYYVWVLLSNGQPKSDEGPYGPYEFLQARSFARISATEGVHDRAVSIGADPQAVNFHVVRIYERGTGSRVL